MHFVEKPIFEYRVSLGYFIEKKQKQRNKTQNKTKQNETKQKENSMTMVDHG